jgi:CRISPR-associated endoribonuclease Cas6
MRLHLKIKADQPIIPFDHQPLLVGTIHKWLGQGNPYHGKTALHSFSLLNGLSATDKGFKTARELYLFISAYETDFIKKIVKGIQEDNTMFSDLRVKDIFMQETPDLAEKEVFYVASPVLLKHWNGESTEHVLFDNPLTTQLLKERLLTKMNMVGLEDDTLSIEFDKSYSRSNTQKIDYNGIGNRASMCPVIIKGKPETKQFAWEVGLGNSTGIGFGALK